MIARLRSYSFGSLKRSRKITALELVMPIGQENLT